MWCGVNSTVKFLCKEFWLSVFRKQIDKLQTNYKGIYVLHDFQFRWINRCDASNAVLTATITAAPAANPQPQPNPAPSQQPPQPTAAATNPNALNDTAKLYTSLACGILRGALFNLGVTATVKAEVRLPSATFTVVDQK